MNIGNVFIIQILYIIKNVIMLIASVSDFRKDIKSCLDRVSKFLKL